MEPSLRGSKVISLIEREIRLTNEWISETDSPEPHAERKTLGTVELDEHRSGSRSIFDDIVDDDP